MVGVIGIGINMKIQVLSIQNQLSKVKVTQAIVLHLHPHLQSVDTEQALLLVVDAISGMNKCTQ